MTTLILVTVGLLFNVYVDLEQSGAIALWNNDELHLFIGTSSLGHRVNLFRYPWFLLKNRLGGVEDADDRQGWLEIIAVTASGTQHHVLKVDYREPGMGPDLYTPIDGSIYANDPELGGLCRWAGDHFEPATAEERQRLDGIEHLTGKDIDHSENGWSKHSFAVGPGDIDDTFTIEVGNKFRILLSDIASGIGGRSFSIDLVRPGHPRERLWTRDLHWGMVSKAQYKHVFHRE